MADDSSEGPGAAKQQAVAVTSIVDQVFGSFADALALQPGRSAVAERLRKALIVDGARTEVTLRTALFESDGE